MITEITQAHLDWWANLSPIWKRIFVNILYYIQPQKDNKYFFSAYPNIDTAYSFDFDEYDLIRSEKNHLPQYTLKSPNDLLKLFQIQSLSYVIDVCAPAYLCVKEIPPLHYFEDLRVLNLGYNCIYDLSHLKSLKNLEYLILHENIIDDLSPLAELTSLKELDLSCNHIRDITPLKNLINLDTLDLWDNDILDVSVLENLAEITKLNIFNNPILNIRPLANLKKLTDLDIGSEDFYFDDTHLEWLQQQLPDCKIELIKMLHPDTDEHFLNRVIWGQYYYRENEDVLTRFEHIAAKQDSNLLNLLEKAQNAYALRNLQAKLENLELAQLPALKNINRALFPTWADELLRQLTILADNPIYDNKKYYEKDKVLEKIQQINPENLNLFFEILRDMDLILKMRKWR